MLIEVHPITPQQRVLNSIKEALSQGELVILPGDSGYFLACNLADRKALQALHDVSGRPKEKLTSVLFKDISSMNEFALINNFAFRIMRQVLPGPFTIVLKAAHKFPKVMLTRRKTIGVRWPCHVFIDALLAILDAPLAVASIRQSEENDMGDPHEIHDRLSHAVHAVVSMGELKYEPTTVISLVDDIPILLRQGQGEIKDTSWLVPV